METENNAATGEVLNARNVGQSVLKHFWDLASMDQGTRFAAAAQLMSELVNDQKQHEISKDSKSTSSMPAPADSDPAQTRLEYHLRLCSPTLVYALRRLARGLTSGRDGARQGYATALAGVLGSVQCISPAGAMVLLEACCEGPMKGGDAKDVLLGRLFGMAAILRAGSGNMDAALLHSIVNGALDCGNRKAYLREAAAAVVIEAAPRLDKSAVAKLLADGPLKALLTTPPADAYPEALVLALVLWPKLPKELLASVTLLPHGAAPPPANLFAAKPSQAAAAAHAPETAAAAAALFSREHLTKILPVLLATSSSHPRLHTLWHYLLPFLLPGFTPAKENREGAHGHDEEGAHKAKGSRQLSSGQLEALWGVVVEAGLMDSSHERKYLGFQLLSLVLPHLRAEHVSTVFSPNLVRTLVNNAKRPETYLHSSAKKTMERVTAFLDKSNADADVKMAVAAALQRLSGVAPQELARDKVTRKLVAGLDAAGVHSFVGTMQTAFLAGTAPMVGAAAGGKDADEEDSATAVADRRATCIEQLASALKFPSVADSDRADVLAFLATHAFLVVDKAAGKSKLPQVAAAATRLAAPLDAPTRSLCAQRLISLIGQLGNAAQHAGGKDGKDGAADAAAAAENGKTPKKQKTEAGSQPAAASQHHGAAENIHLKQVVEFIHQALAVKGVSLATPLADDASSTLQLLRDIETATAKTAAKAAAAGAGADKEKAAHAAARLRALLALLRLLQLHLLGDTEGFEVGLALDLARVAGEGAGVTGLPELQEMAQDGDSDGDADGGDQKGAWCDVLVDACLALLARPSAPLPSAPLRDAVEALWRTCAEALTPAGMADIVRVVVTAGKSGEEEDVFESDEEEEDNDEEDEEDDESEEEEVPAGKKKGGKAAGAAASGGKKRKAADSDDDEEEGDDDDDDDVAVSDDDMDDEAMFKMDDKLAAYLRSMVDGRKGAQERAAALTNFRLRALALLETYAKKAPESPLLLGALVPLLRALAVASRPGGSPALADRLRGVLANKLTKAKAAVDLDQMEGGADGFAAALRRALYSASRDKDKRVCQASTQVLGALYRAAAAAGGQPLALAQDNYRAALKDMFAKKKTRLGPQGVTELARAAPGACLSCIEVAVQAAAAGRNAHTKVAAAQLLQAMARSGLPGGVEALAGCAAGVGAALATAMAGVGYKKDQQAAALKSLQAVVESLKKHAPEKRLAALLGSERLNACAKAIVTAKSVGVPVKVEQALGRLADVMGLGELLDKTKPDNALAGKISKARPAAGQDKKEDKKEDKKGKQQSGKEAAKKEDKKAAATADKKKDAAAAKQSAKAEEDKKQQAQKHKQQQEQKAQEQLKRKTAAESEEEDDEDDEDVEMEDLSGDDDDDELDLDDEDDGEDDEDDDMEDDEEDGEDGEDEEDDEPVQRSSKPKGKAAPAAQPAGKKPQQQQQQKQQQQQQQRPQAAGGKGGAQQQSQKKFKK